MVTITMNAIVTRRIITIWVLIRRASRLSGTSTRYRASAVSSVTTSSEAISQEVAAMTRITSVCSRCLRHSSSAA